MMDHRFTTPALETQGDQVRDFGPVSPPVKFPAKNYSFRAGPTGATPLEVSKLGAASPREEEGREGEIGEKEGGALSIWKKGVLRKGEKGETSLQRNGGEKGLR